MMILVRHEGQSEPPKPASSKLASLWSAVPSLFQSLVIAGVGYALTGQVELALKERESNRKAVQEMATALNCITSSPNKDDVRRDCVRQLALYGADSVGPLLSLGLTKQMRIDEMAEALGLVAIVHKREVCAGLAIVLERAHALSVDDARRKRLDGLRDELRCHWWSWT